MQGVIEILKFDNMQELTEAVGNWYSNMNMKYNALNLLYLCLNTPDVKRTVAFRQHKSTANVERIVQWNKAIVGIVNFG
jgi:hypothetical protein